MTDLLEAFDCLSCFSFFSFIYFLFFACFSFFRFCFLFVFVSGYVPRYSSVEDPTFSLHGSIGYDPNLDNSVFEDHPQQVGAPRAIFDEDERQREPSPDNKMNFGGQQRGWFLITLLTNFISNLCYLFHLLFYESS